LILFAGSTRGREWIDRILSNGWGRLFVDRPAPRPEEPWALDNGVFGSWKSGTEWTPRTFMRSLERAADLHRPVLAVLPDIVGGGKESIAHSMRWRSTLPDMPWYLALQDGMTPYDVVPVLGEVDGLFLGGTDDFKRTARQWCTLAHEHGKRFHYARVSTQNRLREAYRIGADSADSSQMLWSREHFARFERWWRDMHAQTEMFA
jgi:hypothetical protein